MAIYDIFTDASVDKSLRGACAGAITVNREFEEIISERYAIQPNGTNNSGEICAICLGVIQAYNVANPGDTINLFSDSLISLKGVRDWIFDWIKLRQNNVLIKGDKNPVLNQNFHKLIFNTITMYNIKINFYHMRGHMSERKNGLEILINTFKRENNISIESVGDPNYLIAFNNKIDLITRKNLIAYNTDGILYHDTYIDYMYENDNEYIPILLTENSIERYRYLIGKTEI